MGAVRRTGDADQHHAAIAFGIGEQGRRPHQGHLPPGVRIGRHLLGLIADRVAARQVGRNMTETLKNLKRMVEP